MSVYHNVTAFRGQSGSRIKIYRQRLWLKVAGFLKLLEFAFAFEITKECGLESRILIDK